jgi:uncharacterized protein YkwD
MKVFNKIKAFIDEKELNVISIVVVILFVVTIIALFIGFSSSLLNKGGAQLYIDSDGVKYLEINKGQYLREKLVINSGDKLPSISDYFLDMAKIDEDDFSINYYSDGVNGTPLTNFTYEKDGVKYIKGTGEITIVLNSKGNEYETKLFIKDEEKPEVVLKPVIVDEGTPVNKFDFIALYSDNSLSTNYTVDYIENKEYTEPGIYTVGLKICDPSNNCYEGNGELTIISKETGSSSTKASTKKKSSNKSSSSGSGSGSSKKSSSSTTKKSKTSGSSSSLKDKIIVKKPAADRTATVNGNTGCKESGSVGNNNYVIYEKETYDVPLKIIHHYGTTETIKGSVIKKEYDNDAVRCQIIEEKGRVWNYSGFNGTTSELYYQANGMVKNNEAISNNMVNLVNNYRKSNGKKTVANAEILNAMAATRALEILYYGNYSRGLSAHVRPNGLNNSDLFLGLYPIYHDGNITGTSNLAENILVDNVNGSNSVNTPFNAWIKSSGHRGNILESDFKYHGFAKVDYTDSAGSRVVIWVQILSEYK